MENPTIAKPIESKLVTINTSIGTTNSTLSTIDGKIPANLTVASSKLQVIDASANSTLTTASSTLTSLDNKVPVGLGVSTINSVTGCLNVNAVKPQTLQYAIGGIDAINSAYRLIGGNPTATGNQVDTFNFSTANARVYYATTSAGTANTNLFIDYVDAAGGLVLNAGPYGIVASSFTALPSMVSILALRTSTNFTTVAASRELYISPATNTTTSMYHISLANYGVAVATVPAGYYGYISTLTASFESAASLIIVKWSTGGIRAPIYKLNLPAGGTTTVSSGESGYIGGLLVAGESVGFTNNIAVVGKLVQATLTLVAI